MDESKKQLGVNPNDVEGEGEEEEETLHTSRVKVYKLGTKDDKPSWAEMGVGESPCCFDHIIFFSNSRSNRHATAQETQRSRFQKIAFEEQRNWENHDCK